MGFNTASILLVVSLGACATAQITNTRSASAQAGYDTVASCVNDQFFGALINRKDPLSASTTDASALFGRAIRYCGEPVPDLTGDTMTQAAAIHFGYQFKVNMAKDTKMKNSIDGQIIGVGSMIPVKPMVFRPT